MLTQPLSSFGVGYLLCFQQQLQFSSCSQLRGRRLDSLSIEAERTIFEASDPALNRARVTVGDNIPVSLATPYTLRFSGGRTFRSNEFRNPSLYFIQSPPIKVTYILAERV